MCESERNRECVGEGGGTKVRFGDRGLKTQRPPNPPSTEILALNPSYGIVRCRGDFFLSFFFVAVILFNGLSRSIHPVDSLAENGFFSFGL